MHKKERNQWERKETPNKLLKTFFYNYRPTTITKCLSPPLVPGFTNFVSPICTGDPFKTSPGHLKILTGKQGGKSIVTNTEEQRVSPTALIIKPLTTNVPHNIETSQLICMS